MAAFATFQTTSPSGARKSTAKLPSAAIAIGPVSDDRSCVAAIRPLSTDHWTSWFVSVRPRSLWPSGVNARLRSFYFNRQNPDDTGSEAWALGGWVDLASGWLYDSFALGATYYTSLPAYAPELNPVEGVWAWFKGTVAANLCAEGLAPIRHQLDRGRQRLRRRPDRLQGFLHKAGLFI